MSSNGRNARGRRAASRLACALLLWVCAAAAPPAARAAEPPRLLVNTGHHATVVHIAYSPDGALMATADSLQTRLWDAATGRLVRTLPLGRNLGRISFSADGELLAGDTREGVSVYEVKTGGLVAALKGVRRPWFGPAGRALFVMRGRHVELLEAPAYKAAAKFEPEDQSLASGFSVTADGKLLASSHDDSVKLWDVASRRELRVAAKHPADVTSVEFSADGKLLVTCGDDGTTRLWDAATGVEMQRLRLPPELNFANAFYTATFSPDGHTVATGGLFGAHLWDADDGRLTRKLPLGSSSRTDALRFSPDGKTLAGSTFKELRLWSADGATILRVTEPGPGAVRDLAFAPDGSRLYTAGESFAVWNLAGAQVDFVGKGRDLSLSRDGQVLAVDNHQGVMLFEAATAKKVQSVAAGKLANLDFSKGPTAIAPDGRTVVVADKMLTAGPASLFSTETGERLRGLDGHADATWEFVFSPDGKVVASVASKTVKLHETQSGKTLHTFKPGGEFASFNRAAFSPDGALLVTAGHLDSLRAWRVSDGGLARAFGDSESAASVAFSADGKLVAAGMRDGSVKLWRAADGSRASEFAGSVGEVVTVVFHPGGRLLASGGADGRVRLWDMSAGALVAELIIINQREWVVAAADGRFESSPGAEEFLHWADGLKVSPLGAHAELKTPGLLRDLLRPPKN